MAKKDYRYIGKVLPRKDAREIVTGRAEYIDDIKLPKMLHGKVLRSPYPHALIKDIDTSLAEAYPGVRAVLTCKNAPEWVVGDPPQRPFLTNKVRFVGEAVALVAAETVEIAEEALDLIDVIYEQLAAVYDPVEAMKPDAPQLYDQFPYNVLPRDCYIFGPKTLHEVVMGDVEAGFKEADFIAEGTCYYENIANPLPSEPPGAIASWEGPNQVTLWMGTQMIPIIKMNVQRFTQAQVRAIGTYCGGSYGSKNALEEIAAYAIALSKATGRPVKVYFTKEEHFSTFTLRLGSRFQGKVGIKKDGTITALSGEWLVNCGAFSQITRGMVAVGCGEAQLLLRCPNWNLQPSVVLTNRNQSGIVRGFGGQELTSALLPIMGIAMEKADINPLDFFKKNHIKAGDGYYWRDGNWWVFRGPDYSKAINKGAEAFGWKEKWRGWGKPTAVNGTKKRGVGVGVHSNADVGEDHSEAYVRLNSDATVVLHALVPESGMGQRSSLCKMVAEIIDLPLENVHITATDTLINPFDFGLIGSRGTYALGSATIKAAEDARQKLLERAAPILEAKPEDLETRNGKIYIKDKEEKAIPWIRVLGLENTITGHGSFDTDFSLPNFMMIFVEVEVDTETGKTQLLRVVATTDCGQIIDPQILEGQLHGALGSAGIDTGLFEETVLDKTTGHVLNCNMADFKWRPFPDLPEFQNVILETPIASHRFQAIGVGEITTAPGPSAILMAIYNATGKRILDYPATPDKVLRALGKI